MVGSRIDITRYYWFSLVHALADDQNEIAGESVGIRVAGVFESSPLVVNRPFTPGEQAANAMVLLAEPVDDQPAQLEMLATTRSEN